MKAKGNQKFKLGRFELAADLYSQAIDKCPLSAKKKLVLLYRLKRLCLLCVYMYKGLGEDKKKYHKSWYLCNVETLLNQTYTFGHRRNHTCVV